jgi:hypothetical protein
MPEVEAFTGMNAVSDPLTEVSVTQFALFGGILLHYKFLEVIEIDSTLLVFVLGVALTATKITKNIFDCYIAIVISVKPKESLPD